jgi:hypothetical protein
MLSSREDADAKATHARVTIALQTAFIGGSDKADVARTPDNRPNSTVVVEPKSGLLRRSPTQQALLAGDDTMAEVALVSVAQSAKSGPNPVSGPVTPKPRHKQRSEPNSYDGFGTCAVLKDSVLQRVPQSSQSAPPVLPTTQQKVRPVVVISNRPASTSPTNPVEDSSNQRSRLKQSGS